MVAGKHGIASLSCLGQGNVPSQHGGVYSIAMFYLRDFYLRLFCFDIDTLFIELVCRYFGCIHE